MTNSHKRMRGEKSDRLSNLPDSLLIDILSLLDAKEVVQTCLLSKRWRNLWASVPSLHFNLSKWERERFNHNNFVTSFLHLRDGAINVHTFKLFYSALTNTKESIGVWLSYALKHKLRNLILDFRGHCFKFAPNCLFTCDSLEYLYFNCYSGIEPDIVCLPKLRNLSLNNVTMNGDSMQKILSGCPTLETVSMRFSMFLSNSISFQTVKSLKMKNCSFYRLSEPTFSICAPLLKDLKFARCTGSKITFKDMSRVTQAIISNCYLGRNYYNSHDLLKGISAVEYLKLTVHCLKEFSDGELKNGTIFNSLKRLVLDLCWNSCNFGILSSFLECCPNLENFCLLHTMYCCEVCCCGEEALENTWQAEGFCCQDLKIAKFSCCRVHHYQRQCVLQLEKLVLQRKRKKKI